MLRPALIGPAALLSLLVGGCSGNTPSLPALPQLTGTVTEAPIVGSPTEVYERVARGAMSCWFGTNGPLKANYVYHAEAEPAGKGGKAEIVIHERDRRPTENPKGIRAYRVAITPEDGQTTLVFENLKLPEPDGQSHGSGRAAMGHRRPRLRGHGCGAAGRRTSQIQPSPPRMAKRKAIPKRTSQGVPLGLPAISLDTLGRASPAGPEARACRLSAARTGTHRRSAYSGRTPPRC